MPSGRLSQSAANVREILEDAARIITAIKPVVPRFEGEQPFHGLVAMGYRAP